MFTIEDLTKKFHALDDEGKSIVFEQLTKNAEAYDKVMPGIPLIRYILKGEDAVPLREQGNIIRQYNEWVADPKNRAKLRKSR
jgi:hypothetical protein